MTSHFIRFNAVVKQKATVSNLFEITALVSLRAFCFIRYSAEIMQELYLVISLYQT